jgi:hypothetical protein
LALAIKLDDMLRANPNIRLFEFWKLNRFSFNSSDLY